MVDYFISNREKYILHVALGQKVTDINTEFGITPNYAQNNIPLDFQNIGLLTWSNEMNTLYLTGSLEYTDTNGIIDKIVERQLTYCNVEFYRDPQKKDGDINPSFIDVRIDLKFIIDNIEILENKPGMIKYKFHLLSENYMDLFKTANYTNYKDSPELATNIIKNILTNNGDFKVNAYSFETNASVASLQYITQDNDDIQSAIKYLLNKTFYDPKIGLDTSLKTLIYNEMTNQVFLFDTKTDGNRLGCFPPISIKVFKNDTEPTNETPVYIGYAKRESKIQGIIETQNVDFFEYDIETNSIGKSPIDQKKIQGFFNSEKNKNPKMSYDLSPLRYGDTSMEWNSNSQIYENTFKALTQSNGLIVNQFGWIGAIPGYTCNVSIPNNFPTYNDNKSDNDFERDKYQNFTGSWDIFKVVNYINPQTSVFRQKLCLYRNESIY